VYPGLIKLVGRRTHQSVGHRQCALRRVHRPGELALLVVKRFAEVVPACGPFLHCCRRSCAGRQQQRYHYQR
jgi:hypothetical protein